MRKVTRRTLWQSAALTSASLLSAPSRPQGSRLSAAASSGNARRRRRYVDYRNGQLHVTSTAPSSGRADKPAVVCLPMSPRSGRDFDEFANLLATDRWVHAPDVPGFGGSDPPPAPPSIDDYAAALIEGMRALGVGARHSRRIDIVGQHTGAAIAVEIARQAPQLVRRMVLIGVPLWSSEEADKLRATFAKPRPYFEDPEFLAKAWQRDLPSVAAGLSQQRMLLRFTEIMRAGLNSWWGFNAVFDYPMRDRLSALGTPFLAIVLNEALAKSSREAVRIAKRGSVLEMLDLPGSALDAAGARLVAAAREFLDRQDDAVE